MVAPFEPGSVFKVITLSAALETTNDFGRPPLSIAATACSRIGSRIIHDHNSYASLSLEDVLAKSSNIGAIHIGMQVGDSNMYELHPSDSASAAGRESSCRRKRRGCAAAAPVASCFHRVGRDGPRSQRHSVTTRAQAGAIIANGGFLVQPAPDSL